MTSRGIFKILGSKNKSGKQRARGSAASVAVASTSKISTSASISSSGVGGGGSARSRTLLRAQYRVLDDSSRARRLRQQIALFEVDNRHEDPHADLKMHKKAPKFANTLEPSKKDSIGGGGGDSGGGSNNGSLCNEGGRGNTGTGTSTGTSTGGGGSRRTRASGARSTYITPRSRTMSLAALIESDRLRDAPNYDTIAAGRLSYQHNGTRGKSARGYLPNMTVIAVKRHFCAVCGFEGRYTCVVCGTRFCSVTCQRIHNDTRCQRWS